MIILFIFFGVVIVTALFVYALKSRNNYLSHGLMAKVFSFRTGSGVVYEYDFYSTGDIYQKYLGKGEDMSMSKTTVKISKLKQLEKLRDSEEELWTELTKLEWSVYIPQYRKVTMIANEDYDKYVDANSDYQLKPLREIFAEYGNKGNFLYIDNTVTLFENMHITGQRLPVAFGDEKYALEVEAVLEHQIYEDLKGGALNIADLDYYYPRDNCKFNHMDAVLSVDDVTGLVCIDDRISGYSQYDKIFVLPMREGDNYTFRAGVIDPYSMGIIFEDYLVISNTESDYYPMASSLRNPGNIVVINERNKAEYVIIFHKDPEGYTVTLKR